MPNKPITGSTNVAILDSKIVADLCAGKFLIDVTPSVFKDTGATKVLGASIRIKNPNGVAIKDFSSGSDIQPPMTGVFEYPIPTQRGAYQFGEYTIEVRLKDANGTDYFLAKQVTVCTLKNSTMGVDMQASCKEGKLFVSLNTIPLYNKLVAQASEKNLTLNFPTASDQDSFTGQAGSFTVQLFEGMYSVTGDICATYDAGDGISYKVPFNVSTEKNVRCRIDDCSVFNTLSLIQDELNSCKSKKRVEEITNVTLDALRLYTTARLGQDCGEDITEYIVALEKLLGCRCNRESDEGVPVVGTVAPARDIIIEGCNVTSSQSGLTTSYTINNYEYIVEIENNGGALILTPPAISGCKKTQKLTFNIGTVYNQIKERANNDKEFWSSIITIGGISLEQVIADLQQKISDCCDQEPTPTCNAVITAHNKSQSDANVVITWSATGAASVDVYLDAQFIANVTTGTYTFAAAANGQVRTYMLKPKCANGEYGAQASGTFQFSYCPPIALPVLTASTATKACPYNLAQSISSLPTGTVAEWHTQNNTQLSTVVADPANAGAGTYYLFAKNANNCYSAGVAFVLTCIAPCSAPTNLSVTGSGTGNLVRFQSSENPPPNNSYTVVRRLASAGDTPANYTTIGTPTFNSGAARWEINDATALDNIEYIYRAISNCSVSEKPYVELTYTRVVAAVCNPVTNVVATVGTGTQTPTLTGRWGWSQTDPFTSMQAGTLPTVRGTVNVANVGDPVTTDFRAMPTQHYAFYEESLEMTLKGKVTDTGAAFNTAYPPDDVWRAAFVVNGKRYYVTRIPVDYDKAASSRVVFSIS